MAKVKKKRSRGGLVIVLVLLLGIAFIAFKLFGPNTSTRTQGPYLYVHTGADYEQVKQALQQGGFVSDMFTFDLLATRLGLPEHLHAGRYKLSPFMSNYKIIRLLRSGKQSSVKLVINKLRTRNDLVRLLATSLEPDAETVRKLLEDPEYLKEFGLDTNTLMAAVIPDTYEFFWNTTADKTFRKIQHNYAKFWDDTRRQQARDHGLTQIQTSVVASIVDEETNAIDDKPLIASVYLNRVKKGMKLQADPTVKFAIGDFTIRRITGPMLGTVSPYNTYINEGLPPGPICTPSISSLQAVLNAPKTTYIYFCAKDDLSGHSVFASDYAEHTKNAIKYRKALDARGIH